LKWSGKYINVKIVTFATELWKKWLNKQKITQKAGTQSKEGPVRFFQER
jgi:hypothetical protein